MVFSKILDRIETNIDIKENGGMFGLTPSLLNFDPDLHWEWFYISTPEQLASLREEYDNGTGSDRLGHTIKPLPAWVLVEERDGITSVAGTLTDVFESFRDFLLAFEFRSGEEA